MLAEQLLTFAEDFITEYQKFEIIALVGTAVDILQRRATLDDARYAQEAAPVRQKCNAIIASTRFNTYPTEWQRVVSESGFARFLPAKAANEVVTALPTNRDVAPQSSEMNLYRTHCNNALAMAQQFIPFTKQFSLAGISIPTDELGILVELPRRTFENEAGGFCETLKRFSDLVPLHSDYDSLGASG